MYKEISLFNNHLLKLGGVMKITIEKIDSVFWASGMEIDDIQDVNVERFVKKMSYVPELETAYRLGEFDFSNLAPSDQEEIEDLLSTVFFEENYVDSNDDEKEFSLPSSQELDFTHGNAYKGY